MDILGEKAAARDSDAGQGIVENMCKLRCSSCAAKREIPALDMEPGV